MRRAALAQAVVQVLANGLGILGISAQRDVKISIQPIVRHTYLRFKQRRLKHLIHPLKRPPEWANKSIHAF